MSQEETENRPKIEEAIGELEDILSSLESSTTSLEESLARYERGVALLKQCYETLAKAELRILKVTGSEDGRLKLEVFAHSASTDFKPEAAEDVPSDRKSSSKSRRGKPAPTLSNEDIPF